MNQYQYRKLEENIIRFQMFMLNTTFESKEEENTNLMSPYTFDYYNKYKHRNIELKIPYSSLCLVQIISEIFVLTFTNFIISYAGSINQ